MNSASLVAADPGKAFQNWFIARALPLWTGAGFDRDVGLFEERLDFAGAPIRNAPRRAMVQARQIAVCALAQRCGWADHSALAIDVGHTMIDRFWAADGDEGWVFALLPDGGVDRRRDLYAHAFVLFALAGLIAIAPQERRFRESLEATLAFVDRYLSEPQHGGYHDCRPRADTLRRQNPHMHMLEAYLELFEVTSEERFLKRAEDLVALARRVFLDPSTGALREIFDDGWNVWPAPSKGLVEPGHQFEWAWLLRRCETLSGCTSGGESHVLVESALRAGVRIEDGRIIDQLDEKGQVLLRSSRCWPHCEAIKSLVVERGHGKADHSVLVDRLLERLLWSYCLPELNGGYVDQRGPADEALSEMMPASTLYHLGYALAEWQRSSTGTSLASAVG